MSRLINNKDLLVNAIAHIEEKNDSDIYVYSGDVTNHDVDQFILRLKNKENKRTNCTLMLTTYGGNPDAGYRLARVVKKYYDKFFLYVYGYCKSTGTLIALAADKICMGDFGEFGPLDIQLTKDDELSNTSGLSYLQSLSHVQEAMYDFFEDSFLKIKASSGNTITTKTAAEIASKLAIGLVSPITSQLDPIKLGEVARSMNIANQYGRRLCENENLVSVLIVQYPSHGFVIDRNEASQFFPSVEEFDDQEYSLENTPIGGSLRLPAERAVIYCLSTLLPKPTEGKTEANKPNESSLVEENDIPETQIEKEDNNSVNESVEVSPENENNKEQ